MPRTKGSKNKPKVANDYASQIAEKQEAIASLNTEITSIQKAIEEQKNTLKEKKSALKKAEKEVESLEAKKAKADAKAAEEAKKATSRECVRLARYIFLKASCTSRLAKRRMFPSSCMPIRKQSCVHSKAASGFALPANW